ncbi:MAG: TetR/AcrR family transcriptional regulator [Pseudomonadota bacterium]
MAVKDQSTDKTSQILKAATVVLRDQGLQSLSFETIASEAGLSRQLVRYYFSDLDALVAALCDFLAAAYRDILVAGVVEVAQVERLNFFLDFFFGLSDRYPMPANLEVYDAMVAYAVGSDDMRDRMCLQYKTLGDVITHELAIAHPALKGRACEELSYLFVSMMHSHWSFVASLGHTRDHGRLTRRAIDRLIASYAADPSPTQGLERPWARD